jgi:hypothetical protein
MDVASALGIYLDSVDSCAPGLVEGLYVVGSFALDDWIEGTSDIDVVAVTADPVTDDDFAHLLTAHALLAEVPGLPVVEGPYLAWGDLVTPPSGLHRPWAGDGRLRHDGDCFDINPLTWFVLAEHGVTVRGPTPDRLGIVLDIDERVRFAIDNLIGYWRPLARDVRDACRRTPASAETEEAFDDDSFVWCALGALRLHRTAFRGDVVSATGAGLHGLEVADAVHHDVISLGLEVRAAGTSGTSIPLEAMAATADLIDWCVDSAEQAWLGH